MTSGDKNIFPVETATRFGIVSAPYPAEARKRDIERFSKMLKELKKNSSDK